LRLSICLIGIATPRAFAATIARVNRVQGYSVKLRLVFKKVSKLRECPITVPCSLATSNRDSLGNAFEIFNGDASRCVFSLENKTLADNVIRVTLETGLLARKLFKFAFTRACTFALQVAATVRVFAPRLINLRTCKRLTIAVSYQIYDAEIHAQNVLGIAKQRFVNVANYIQIEVAFAVNQISLAFAEWQQLSLIVATLKWNCLATFKRPDGHSLVFLKRENPIVICDAAVLTKDALDLLINLVSIGNFSNQSHDYLSRQIKGVAGRVVGEFMQLELFEGFTFPSLRTDCVARLVRALNRFPERVRLLFGRLQLEIHNQLHVSIIARFFKYGTLDYFFNDAPPQHKCRGVRVLLCVVCR